MLFWTSVGLFFPNFADHERSRSGFSSAPASAEGLTIAPGDPLARFSYSWAVSLIRSNKEKEALRDWVAANGHPVTLLIGWANRLGYSAGCCCGAG